MDPFHSTSFRVGLPQRVFRFYLISSSANHGICAVNFQRRALLKITHHTRNGCSVSVVTKTRNDIKWSKMTYNDLKWIKNDLKWPSSFTFYNITNSLLYPLHGFLFYLLRDNAHITINFNNWSRELWTTSTMDNNKWR